MVADPIVVSEAILKQHGATEIYVFGSRANGTATPDSDLDLAVRGVADKEYFAVLGELLCAVSGGVDLVFLDDGSPFAEHLKAKIERGWLRRVALESFRYPISGRSVGENCRCTGRGFDGLRRSIA